MFSDIRAFQELSNDHPGWAGGQWIDNFAAAGTDWSRDKGVVTPGAGPYMHEDVGGSPGIHWDTIVEDIWQAKSG